MWGERRGQGQNPDDIRGSGSRQGCKVPWSSLLIVHQFHPGHSFIASLAVRCGRVAAFSSVGCRGQCCVPSQPGYALSPSGLLHQDGSHPRLVMRPGGCPRGQYRGTGKELGFLNGSDHAVATGCVHLELEIEISRSLSIFIYLFKIVSPYI